MEAAWCTCRSSVVAHCARAVVSKTVCWGSGWNNVLLEFLIRPINEAIMDAGQQKLLKCRLRTGSKKLKVQPCLH